MRIGLFTDTYLPMTSGITYVVDILQRNLEKLGHDVYIVAPEPRARHWFRRREHHVIRMPAIEGLFFQEQMTSFFFPNKQYRRISELRLNAIILFTPAQIGLLGAYVALQDDIPLIEHYSTDLVAYTKQYPAVLPGVLALLLASPLALKVRPRELASLTKSLSTSRDKQLTFSQETVKHTLNLLHARCDLLIAVSEKSAHHIKPYSAGKRIVILPTGVNKLEMSEKERQSWRKKWRAGSDTIVYLYAGRLSKEKNIELLLAAYERVARRIPDSRLVIAGSFSHETTLKQLAAQQQAAKHIHFIGRIPRERLGSVYAAADVFCFPSLTDTQALVLNEAAHAGLPIVWCDELVNAVAMHQISGIVRRPTVQHFASGMVQLGTDRKMRAQFGKAASSRAGKFTELQQTKLLVKQIEAVIRERESAIHHR